MRFPQGLQVRFPTSCINYQGEPTLWPRFATNELEIARRFEQIFVESFRAHELRTLAVICFPLGTWVLFCSHLLMKGWRNVYYQLRSLPLLERLENDFSNSRYEF